MYRYPPNTVTSLRALPPHQPLFCVPAVQQQHGRPACSSPHPPGGTETHLSAQQESASVQGAEGVSGQHEYICWQKPSGM